MFVFAESIKTEAKAFRLNTQHPDHTLTARIIEPKTSCVAANLLCIAHCYAPQTQ